MQKADATDVSKVMARNAEIQECRRQVEYWTQRLEQLEAERRKVTLMTRFEVDPDGTWESLTEEERQDKNFIIAALRNSASIAVHDPWSDLGGFHDWIFPERLLTDRDVVLAYVAAESSGGVFFNGIFEVPVSLRDDKEVMLAVCTENPEALKLASPRLRNDYDIVKAAFSKGSDDSRYMLQYASDRLRKDKDILLAAVESDLDSDDFNWLKFALLHQMTASEEKEVALAVLEHFPDSDGSDWGHEIGFEHFSEAVRGDKELALRFVEIHGDCLEWCSDRLKTDREVVKTAIAQSPCAVNYCEGKIREELTSDRDFMLTVIEEEDGGFLLPLAPSSMTADASIVLEALKTGLEYKDVPSHMRVDPKILQSAFAHGSIEFAELPEEFQDRKSFLVGAVRMNPDTYNALSEGMQKDEQIALETIKAQSQAGGEYTTDIASFVLDKVPSLIHSREAVMAVTKIQFVSDDLFLGIIRAFPFHDDREVMLSAYRNVADAAEFASDRLRNDRGFILAALSEDPVGLALCFTSNEFQQNNIDVVLKAIETMDIDNPLVFDDLIPDLWNYRPVVLAWLKRGLELLKDLPRDSCFCEDSEVVQLAVKAKYSEFRYASESLRADRDFVLSLVKIHGYVLAYASRALRSDFDILVAAITNQSRTISACFTEENDFDILVSFAFKVRSKLELYDVFVSEILRGICISKPHVAPAHRCHLPMLDRGSETSIGFKKLIAEFLGAPLGEELQMLRKVSSNLLMFGY